jgi:hypothetical protein
MNFETCQLVVKETGGKVRDRLLSNPPPPPPPPPPPLQGNASQGNSLPGPSGRSSPNSPTGCEEEEEEDRDEEEERLK